MAMNPMQRRSRNSFLIGFLVSLILMTIVVIILLMRIKTINEAKEALEALQVQCYVAADDLESGESITIDEDFVMATVQTTIDQSTLISSDDFEYYDSEGNIEVRYNEDGTQKYKELVMRIDVPAGAFVTKDMFIEAEEEISNTERLQEYNMIVLPSQLKNGDYVDIRLSLPTGQDYVVLSKKKVLGTDASAVWFNMDEEEMLTINNAIVESYVIAGSKLYATPYTNPGMQKESETTYTVSGAVLTMIQNSPNITQEAKDNLWLRYDSVARTTNIETLLDKYRDSINSTVESKTQEEVSKVQAARQSYVESLAGTEDIGFTR